MTETAWQWVESLGHWLLAWTVVVVVICTWLLVTKVRRAGVRYAGWLVATFAGAAFLPVVLFVSPVVSVPQAVGYVGGDAAFAAERLGEWSEWFGRDRGASRIAATAAGLSGEGNRQAGTGRVSFVGLMFAAWTVGLAFYLVRLGWAAVRVRRLIAGSNLPVPTELRAQFDTTRRELGIGRTIRLVVHPETRTPLCTGIVRPTVVWPAPANDTLCPRERRAAMIHELAHLKRYDDWLRLAGELWQAICWFYLPVHWTLSRLRREQEYLCDDLAALTLDRPETYAQLLLDHTRVRVPSPILCSSFGGGSAMTSRVRRMLRSERRLTPLSRKQTTILVALSAVLLVGAGSLRLVGFVTHARAAEPAAKQTVRSSDQGSEGENAAVATLKALGARVRLNDNGKVVSVNLAGNKQITDAGLEHIKGLTHLKTLRLDANPQITDAGLEHIEGLTNLEELGLFRTHVTDAGLAHLTGLTKLQWLLVGGPQIQITDAGLVHLKGLTNLEWLGLPYTQVTGPGLVHLQGLTHLQSLGLSRSEITDAGMAHLKGLTNLQTLLLKDTQVGDRGLARLKQLPKLQELDVASTRVTDAGLLHVKELSNLQKLYLWNNQVTDAGLVQLKDVPNLQELWLDGTQFTDAAVAHLRGLPKLETLVLAGAQVSDANLVHLKGLSNLHELRLFQTQVTDAGLLHLQGLTKLETLGLVAWDRPQITDAGLTHLKGLTNLKTLNVNGLQITDASLKHLKGLKNLKNLNLLRTKVSRAGVDQLKEALPNCNIHLRASWSDD